MAFVPVSSFTPRANALAPQRAACSAAVAPLQVGRIRMQQIGGNGKKPSRNRRYRPGKGRGAAVEKKKLEPEETFIETAPSPLELVVPTLSILTVIGIIPFVGAVARALWVRYKVTSRRIAISSGFQGKDQTEIIYRDIEQVKFVRRLGGAADCVLTLRDGAKLEIRAIPDFDKVYEYVMERVDEDVREASGPA